MITIYLYGTRESANQYNIIRGKMKESKGRAKIKKVMKEFSENKLHSGSKKGAKVTNPKQAIAIGISEARKAGAKIPKKK
jgi:Family of unknown function (DUF6496)